MIEYFIRDDITLECNGREFEGSRKALADSIVVQRSGEVDLAKRTISP
jgi:hypothetical protein